MKYSVRFQLLTSRYSYLSPFSTPHNPPPTNTKIETLKNIYKNQEYTNLTPRILDRLVHKLLPLPLPLPLLLLT